MKNDHGLERLMTLARRGRSVTHREAPFGFATHLAACAFAEREDPLIIWERVARRFLVGALLTALCVGTGIIRPHVQKSQVFPDFAGLNESAENLW